MVSKEFIHDMDEIVSIENTYSETTSFIESCLMDIKLLGVQKSDLEFFEEYTSESAEYIREGVGTAIKKLGDKIIEIIKRCKEFIKKKFSELKNLKWRMSSDEKKIETAISKNPQLADNIKIAIAEGNIKISDIKDIKTFYDEVENIMKEMKKDQINPKSLRGRFERAKKKLAASEKPIKSVLGIAASAAGLYLTYNQIKKFKRDSVNYVEDVGKNSEAILDKIGKERDALTNVMNNDPDNKHASAISLQAQMAAEVERISGKNMSTVTKAKAGLIKRLDKVVQKLPGMERGENEGYHTVRRKLGTQKFDVENTSKLSKLKKRLDEINDKIATFDKTVNRGNTKEDLYTRHHNPKTNAPELRVSGSKTENDIGIDRAGLDQLFRSKAQVEQDIRNLENKIRSAHRSMKR